jgi:hypothetical protein
MRLLQRTAARITVAVVSIAGASLTTQAQQPPKAGCRTVSKLEYNIAKKGKRDYQLGRQILPNRTVLAKPLLALSCLIWGGQQWGSG